MNSELPHLNQLAKMTPRTASGRVGSAWMAIKANLEAGKAPREVYDAAERDGLGVSYAQFRVYVHRLRKRDIRSGLAIISTHSREKSVPLSVKTQRNVTARQAASPQGPSDPLRNLREQRARKQRFEYDPFPARTLTQ